ncbi:unnamed protein product [Candida verbasci]|uniref:t-SNARE coiled-coil homology domain-containing protein n=1 Tax=Candida verbasci TaxID=1227364 RepID=A0A9W4TZC7_9ASCO|nr:unnamed protein product [Candida verbasci]
MSFNNPFEDDLERQISHNSTRYKDYPEFDTISSSIENQLNFINKTQLNNLKSQLSEYEQSKDTELAESLSNNFKKTTEYYKKLNDFIKKLNHIINELNFQHEDIEVINYFKQKEQIQIKLVKDSLSNFKNLQKRYELNQQNSISQSSRKEESESQGQVQSSVQIEYEPVNAEELEQQTLLIQEREREIHQIQQDTQEINDIFTNLSGIINEQQFTIDNIENNIFSYSSNAKQAVSELRSAERWQKGSNGRMLCCFMILLGVAALLVLIMAIF